MALDPNRLQFLETGARSYLQGAAAIAMFQQEVYRVCRQELTKHRPELANAMGVSLDGELKVNVSPRYAQDADWTSASIGVELNQKGVVRLYLYVWWRYGDDNSPHTSAVVSVYCDKGETRARLWSAFKKAAGAKVYNDSGELWFEYRLAPAEFPKLEDKLDEALTDWISIWSQIGGLKKYLSK